LQLGPLARANHQRARGPCYGTSPSQRKCQQSYGQDPANDETDFPVDPRDPKHILAQTRTQQQIIPGEDAEQARALTGAPTETVWVYKNGLLIESWNNGRSFQAAIGAPWAGDPQCPHRARCFSNCVLAQIQENHATRLRQSLGVAQIDVLMNSLGTPYNSFRMVS